MIINQVASDLSISSYSYRYLSARLLVALDNPFDQTTETVLHPLPENGAYGANSQLAPVTGPLVIPTPIDKNSSASLGEIDASYGCGESLPDFPNVSKVSNIFYNSTSIFRSLRNFSRICLLDSCFLKVQNLLLYIARKKFQTFFNITSSCANSIVDKIVKLRFHLFLFSFQCIFLPLILTKSTSTIELRSSN